MLRRRAEEAWRMRWSSLMLVQWHVLSQSHGWNFPVHRLMGIRQSHTTWNGTSSTWVSRCEAVACDQVTTKYLMCAKKNVFLNMGLFPSSAVFCIDSSSSFSPSSIGAHSVHQLVPTVVLPEQVPGFQRPASENSAHPLRQMVSLPSSQASTRCERPKEYASMGKVPERFCYSVPHPFGRSPTIRLAQGCDHQQLAQRSERRASLVKTRTSPGTLLEVSRFHHGPSSFTE